VNGGTDHQVALAVEPSLAMVPLLRGDAFDEGSRIECPHLTEEEALDLTRRARTR